MQESVKNSLKTLGQVQLMKLTHTPVPKLTSSYPDGNTELLNGAKHEQHDKVDLMDDNDDARIDNILDLTQDL